MGQAVIKIRRSQERGHASHGWLNSYHTFSFADYYDQAHMGFRHLRVINDDKVSPGQGFGMHPHRDMEIITHVISGELEHKDSMGNGEIIKAGDFQYMSAGKGVTHSEFNPSDKKEVHLLQIWIIPSKKGLTPSYGQLNAKDIKREDNGLALVISGKKQGKAIVINQDVNLYHGKLSANQKIQYTLAKNRAIWLHVIAGELNVSANTLFAGDAIAIEQSEAVDISSNKNSEFLLFDLN